MLDYILYVILDIKFIIYMLILLRGVVTYSNGRKAESRMVRYKNDYYAYKIWVQGLLY